MRELLQQALAALNTCGWDYDYEEESYKTFDGDAVNAAIEALKHELNKPDFLTTDHLSPYEQGFVDGMAKQAQSSVDRAVNAMSEWVELTPDDVAECIDAVPDDVKGDDVPLFYAYAVEAKLREKNT